MPLWTGLVFGLRFPIWSATRMVGVVGQPAADDQADAGAFDWRAFAAQPVVGLEQLVHLRACQLFMQADAEGHFAPFRLGMAAHRGDFLGNLRRLGGADSAGSQITDWVQANFTFQTVDGITVYDLQD